jgi:hypothetical protein
VAEQPSSGGGEAVPVFTVAAMSGGEETKPPPRAAPRPKTSCSKTRARRRQRGKRRADADAVAAAIEGARTRRAGLATFAAAVLLQRRLRGWEARRHVATVLGARDGLDAAMHDADATEASLTAAIDAAAAVTGAHDPTGFGVELAEVARAATMR